MKQNFLFAEENRLEKLSKLGDCLERLKIIDWESFRPTIALALIRERKSNAGRPPFNCILLFKTIVLQKLYNLSDDQTEYKDHVKADADSKLILDYTVIPANVHDSKEFVDFFNEKDEVWYADSAYIGKKLPEHVRNEVCEKGYRNKPLTEEQKKNNRRKFQIRCRIEHVFAFMTMSMRGLTVRSIGIERAVFNIGLTNLVYNLCRYSFLSRKEAAAG